MRKWLKRLFRLAVIFFLLAVGITAGDICLKGYDMYRTALEQTSLTEMRETIESKEHYRKLEDLPQDYLEAVISVEDHRFYRHGGFDIFATTRALWNDILAGAYVEGGSTISQQLAKNLYFTQEKKLERKVAEVFMSFAMEKEYGKDKILELYVNSIYFGSGYYCVWDACEGYFGKEPMEMDQYECTFLAGIPNAPSAYDPTQNPELAKQRHRQVLEQMVKHGDLTQEEMDALLEEGKQR